jgi:hypothetical protein
MVPGSRNNGHRSTAVMSLICDNIQLYTWPQKKKHKAFSEKLDIIKKVDVRPCDAHKDFRTTWYTSINHVMHTKISEQCGIPVSTLNNNMAGKKDILQQWVISQAEKMFGSL